MFINAPTDSLTLADSWERVDRDLLDRFAKAPAANIGDVFDRLLVMDGGIRPFTSSTRLVGTALPILTRAGDNLAIHRALDDARPGDVLVINGQGDLSRALLGDLIGEIMVSKGVVGGVVVSPGDLIVTDPDGVVVVPHHRADWAADQVDRVMEKEEALRRRILAARGRA
jgi:regulator of RNase E activity RraA